MPSQCSARALVLAVLGPEPPCVSALRVTIAIASVRHRAALKHATKWACPMARKLPLVVGQYSRVQVVRLSTLAKARVAGHAHLIGDQILASLGLRRRDRDSLAAHAVRGHHDLAIKSA